MASNAPAPRFRFFTSGDTGVPVRPLVGGKVYTYEAGTTTPKITYKDAAGTIPNTNPVILNSRGEADIWLGTGAYKIEVRDSTDVQQGGPVDGIKSMEQYALDAGALVEEIVEDLASTAIASKGAGMIGMSYSLPYASQTVGWFLQRSVPTLVQYGALGNGADDITAVNLALAGQKLTYVPPGEWAVSAQPTNSQGSEWFGPGRILKPVANGRQQVNLSADYRQHVFGEEYLFSVYNKLRARTPFLGLAQGDSTTFGDSIADVNAKIHKLVQDLVADYGFKITMNNEGHSGINAEQWRTTYLAGELAQNPDLMIIRYGVNDPGWNKNGTAGTADQWEAERANRRDIGDYTTTMRAALTTIRAARPVDNLGIILMTPNSTSDSPNGRDEKWYEQVRLVLRQLAREFMCAFIDTYSLIPDSRNASTRWMDAPFGDARAVHPLDIMNRMIAPYIADLLVPDGLAFNNVSSTQVIPPVTTLPPQFPIGYSTWRVQWTINGTLLDGALINFRSADGVSRQTVFSYNLDTGIATRIGDDTAGWRNWTSAPPGTVATANGWVTAGRAVTYHKVEGLVQISGRISSGTTAGGTVIATLPVGYRPAYEVILPAYCGASLNTAAILKVATNGEISVVSVPSNAALDLSPMHFSTY